VIFVITLDIMNALEVIGTYRKTKHLIPVAEQGVLPPGAKYIIYEERKKII
jgi:hypothetical protein